MSNKYYNVFAKRISAKQMSASNAKKCAALLARLKSDKLAALLRDSEVDASVFDRAIYASEKLIKFVSIISDSTATVNANMFAAFKTAMLCAANNEALRDSDIDASVSSAVVVDDTRKHLVFQRSKSLTLATEDAQSQQCIDVLRSLNIAKQSASASVYVVNRNAIAVAIEQALDARN